MAKDELEINVAPRVAEANGVNGQSQAELTDRTRVEDALWLSEQRLRLAVRASNTGLWDWNIRTGEIYFSPEWKSQIGYEDHELENRLEEWEDRLHPDDRERTLSTINAYLEKPWSNYEVEFRLRHKDGSYRWILARAALFTDDNGKPQRMLGSHLDITERRRAEEALRTSERLYRTLARNFPNGGVALFDRELRYMIADGSDLALVGLSKEALEGKTIWEVFSPEVSKMLEPAYRAALAGTSTVQEVPLRGHVYLRHAVPVTDEHGEIVAGMVMSQDVTERKQAEEALRRTEFEYRNLVESIQAIVWRADARTFQFSFVSKEAEALLGYPAEQWITNPMFWSEHIHADDRDWAVSFCVKATEEKKDHVFEYRMIAADGRVVWLRDIVRVVIENDNVRELVGVMIDITERKLTEQALQESERKFSTIFQTIPDVVSITRLRDGLMLEVNDAWNQRTGYLKSDRVGKTFQEFNLYLDQEVRERHTQALLATGEVHNLEAAYRIKDGSVRYGLQSAKVIELDGEQCAVAITRDITDNKAAEEAVRQSEAKYRALVENTPDIIARFDRNCRYLFVNSAVKYVSDLKPDDFIGKSLREVGFTEEQASFREEVIRKVFETRTPFETEFEFDGANGRAVFEWRVYPEFDAEGNMQTVLSINRNITLRKRAEDQARQFGEQLRALSAHLQFVREEERTMIAREVHDELGQALTGLKMDLSSLQRDLAKTGVTGPDRLTEKTSSMSKLIDETIQTVRRIATQLRPGILDDLGLVAAIEWQAQDFQNRTGINCRLETAVEELDLDQDRSTATFRIFQESLTNVARHSEATSVDVSLSHRDDRLVLEIIDNGKGIPEADIHAGRSLGLLGMRERARLLGGELKISGAPGKGTVVTVRIPLGETGETENRGKGDGRIGERETGESGKGRNGESEND